MKVRSVLTWRKENDIVRHKRCLSLLYVSVALLLCTILLISCAKQPAKTGAGAQAEVTVLPSRVVSPTPPTALSPTPNITLKVINCPSSLSSLKWDKLVGTKTNVNKVQQVMCGSLESYGSLEALINVRYYSADSKLDFYIYDNLFGTPVRAFSMQGLLNGDAQISPTGTIMTAEVGSGDSIKGSPDVFKEYQWQSGTFEQVLFPGIYPDMTYYQAERDQAQLNAELAAGNKRNAWKATFNGVANNLATKIFHWTDVHTSTVQYSVHDGIYIASVSNLGPGGGGFVARMFHLDNNTYNIYEIMQVTSIDGNVILNSPTTGAQVTSPISMSGSAPASGSILGRLVIYSDTYTTIGSSVDIHSPASSGYVNFTQSVPYQLNSSGVQEGVAAFYETNQNNANASNQVVMIKVFLRA
ncbi:MAG: hypothetical protein ACJ795_22175 [Ktedonobacteraceae bacterium]